MGAMGAHEDRVIALLIALFGLALICVFPPLGIGLLLLAILVAILNRPPPGGHKSFRLT